LLDPLVSDLGRLAVGIADSLNLQQQKGLDIQGTLGQAFFDSGTARVSEHVDNTGAGQVTATITDIGQLTNNTYELTFDGGSNFSLTRSDGTVTSINTGGTSPFTTAAVDGFTLTLVAGANVGDRFEISPTATAATNLTLALQNGGQIAAASPVVASVSGSNTGSGVITDINVGGITNLPLTGAPVSGNLVLSFSSATNQLSLTPDPLSEGPLAFNPATHASGKSFSILGGDVTFVVSGNPADGDQIVLSHNSGALGDNRNAVAMVALSSERLLDSNRATFQESYGRLVASVGSKTRDAEISSSASGALLDRAVERRESVSGVNLDEEAANLLRYQQAYQASARLFSVADSLFQTLLSSLGR
jgi:flagellar hook-associated protein 1 FlgK